MTNTAPTITDPGALSLLEGGTTVATISASDAQNNSLSFSIASGDDQELFAITTGGDLSFVSALTLSRRLMRIPTTSTKLLFRCLMGR